MEKEIQIILENDGTMRFLYDYNSKDGQLFSDKLIVNFMLNRLI